MISCGATNLKFNGTSTISATEVPGANKYQFRFTNTAGQPAYARTIAFPTRSFTLTPWLTKPLKAGRTYNVQVRASFDNGATWCDYGPSCTVKISWTPLTPFAEPRGYEAEYTEEPTELLLYPNPTNGDQVRIQLGGIDPELTIATLDITDLFGKRVMSSTLPINDGELNSVLSLDGDLADGLYILTITVGEYVFNERLVITR
ncbi:MAG: T9SS type A sorting domain-containing protein [Flavobacteriales bacterium]|nr:T9SS type A sorting domain-containing protein [Flavobacteriales bacterium]